MEFTYNLPDYQYTNEFYERLINTPHLIIAGTTGAGKSVLIDNIIYYILRNRTPFNTRLILIDPKKVSLDKYKHLPFTDIYADENSTIIQALRDVILNMETILNKMKISNVVKSTGADYYIIVDELGDLLTTCKKECLPLLQRIAQLGRAPKFHLICATQAPSRAVLSAQLTINFTGRLALRCATKTESKQILNGFTGAETLPDYGKCIFNENGRLYNCDIELTPDDDIKSIIDFWEIQYNAQKPAQTAKQERRKIDYKSIFNAQNIGHIIGFIIALYFNLWLIKFVFSLFTPNSSALF